jgi:hypothetical protein
VDRENSGSLTNDPYFGRPLRALHDTNEEPVLVHLPSGDYYRKKMTIEFSNNTTEEADVYGKTKPILSRFIVRIKKAFSGLQRAVTSKQLSEIHAADVIAVAVKGMNLDKDQVRFEIRNVQYANHSRSLRAV